jgi:hypothetical protein
MVALANHLHSSAAKRFSIEVGGHFGNPQVHADKAGGINRRGFGVSTTTKRKNVPLTRTTDRPAP